MREVLGAGVSGAGDAVHGPFVGLGDVTEDGAGNSGGGEMVQWVMFAAAASRC